MQRSANAVAARSAASLPEYVSMKPLSVTVPFSTATPTAVSGDVDIPLFATEIAMRLLGQATYPVDHEAGAHREPEILCCHAWP